MKIEQRVFSSGNGWVVSSPSDIDQQKAQIVFLFGDRDLLKSEATLAEIRSVYPNANLVGCSTAGEICKDEVIVNTVVSTAVQFDKTEVKVVSEPVRADRDSYQLGRQLAKALPEAGLKHVFIISEGLNINGSRLTVGLNSLLGEKVSVTGGLAGDYAQFQETVVIHNGVVEKDKVVAIGFYGDSLKVGYGSKGGWSSFGVDRLVTKSDANVLYELEGKPALSVYKTYLGNHAAQLPSSALMFPISFRSGDESIVRTILSINETDGSMTFAGDIPEGVYVRFMNASSDKLYDGATGAAEYAMEGLGESSPELAFLISCVGRKIVLKNRIDEEVEVVREVLGDNTTMIGFYSFGEICPILPTDFKCELHNQTMTITLFKEI